MTQAVATEKLAKCEYSHIMIKQMNLFQDRGYQKNTDGTRKMVCTIFTEDNVAATALCSHCQKYVTMNMLTKMLNSESSLYA
jgi:hypothetical protein